jgi:streptogramin lyase
MTLSLSSKVSIASTDGLLGLALIACNPELVSSGLTTSVITEFPFPTPNSAPFGITFGFDGSLWFTEVGGNKIGRFRPRADSDEVDQ